MVKSFFVRRWKLLLNIVTIIALVAFVYFIRDEIGETFANIQRIHWWFLVIVVLLQVWNYDAQTRMYKGLFAIVGNKFTYRKMLTAALELNFVNNVFPSGGVSGISYFGARMRDQHVTAGKATLVQLMKLLLLFVSFEILLVVGLVLLAAGDKANNLVLLVCVALTTALVIGTALFLYILGTRKRIQAFHSLIRSIFNSVNRKIRGANAPYRELSRVGFLLDELYVNFKVIKADYKQLKWPLLQAMFANLSEMLCIYVIYLAFGSSVNFGAIIVAYAVANFAGFVSVLPGGVGVYELLMTSVLVAAGVPAALSLPVTVTYRVLTAAIQLPPGYICYQIAVRQDKLASHKA